MTFAQLRALVAVIDSGGFTSAATVTGSSQPAISHAIASLERELGAKLLDRDKGAVQATDLGLRVAALARQILDSAYEITQHAARAETGIVAPVQVAAVPNVAACILPGALALLAARQPGIDVTVLEGGTDEIPKCRRTSRRRRVPVGGTGARGDRAGAPWRRRARRARAGEPCVGKATCGDATAAGGRTVRHGQLRCEPYINEVFTRAGVSVRPTYYMRQTPAIAKIVAQGLGVSIISAMSAANVADGVAVLRLEPPAQREFAAFWPRRRKTAAARAVVEAVREVVAGRASAADTAAAT